MSCHLRTFESGRQLDDYGTPISLQQWCHRNRHRLPDESRTRERPVHRDRRNKRRFAVASGRTQRDDRPQQRSASQAVHARSQCSVYECLGSSCLSFAKSGHPEAFFEAFANIYTAAFDAIIAKHSGAAIERKDTVYPNVYDGVEGMRFIQQCVASSQKDGAWLPFECSYARI